jgi:hypothetical protein
VAEPTGHLPLGPSDTGSRLRRPDPADTGTRLRPPGTTGPSAGLGPSGATTDTGSRLRRPDPADTGTRLRPPGTTGPSAGLSPLGPPATGSRLRPPGGPESSAGLGRPSRAGVTDSSAGLPRLGPPGVADPGAAPGPLGAAGTGSRRRRAEVVDPADTGSRLRPPGVADSPPGPGPLGAAGTGSRRRREATDTGTRPPGVGDPGAGPGPLGLAGTEPGPAERTAAEEPARGRRRAGATHGDLAHTAGATALQPRLAEPDEVTDTGAHRARSAFRVADDPEPAEEPYAEDGYAEEPSLVLQWGIFLVQTLTGAAVGLGVWLGFYRLWSTWPFYAAPAVGVAIIAMLVVARVLRRRYGHELDLLTAIVTVGVGTVLTVLPAAFTLQGLA